MVRTARLLFAAASVCLALMLAGCGPGSKLEDFTGGVTKIVKLATAPFANPLTATNTYQLRLGQDAGLTVANTWRRFCWSKPYEDLKVDPVGKYACTNRRPTLRAIEAAEYKLEDAIGAAEWFVKENPTLDATKAIAAARDALARYQNAVPKL